MMTTIEQNALVVALIDNLHAHGSWCGETHVQKAAYFVEELCKVPLEFQYRLYRQSPFSFDLQDRLTGLRADGFLTLEIAGSSGGPKIRATEIKDSLLSRGKKVLGSYKKAIEFVASKLGAKHVTDLEYLATALMVSRESGNDVETRAKAMVQLKPQLQLSVATDAVKTIDSMRVEYSRLH
jgi:hypothetical protein